MITVRYVGDEWRPWRTMYRRTCEWCDEAFATNYLTPHKFCSSRCRTEYVASNYGEHRNQRATALQRDLAVDYDDAYALVKATPNDFAIRLIVQCCVLAHRPLSEGVSILKGAGV